MSQRDRMGEDSVFCGCVEGTVAWALVELIPFCQEGVVVLVRCWDSTRESAKLESIFDSFGVRGARTEQGLSIEVAQAEHLQQLASHFFGFDEIWVGTNITDWGALAQLLPMTSESCQLDSRSSEPFREALVLSGAYAGLGDGCGLNVVCKDEWGSAFQS